MTPREEMLARAKAVLERVEVERADYTGSCTDCKYSSSILTGGNCLHPIVTAGSFLQDQGTYREINIECDYQRGGDSLSSFGPRLCGPNGALFEPYEPVISKVSKNIGAFIKGLFT